MSKTAVGIPQNDFVVRFMKYSGYERYKKVAIIVIAVGALLACTAAGTLAAFSATYTWQSDDGTAGDFGFSDTTYSFDLFGDAPMYPGMSGGAVLNGPDFGDNTVEWAFEESNAGKIPIVFYIEDTDGSIVGIYYSAYDFSALQDLFVRADDDGYIPLNAVSSDVIQLAKELHVGCRLCWLWPSEFYADASGTPAEQTEAINVYSDYCFSLCVNSYGFDTTLIDIIAAHEKTILGVIDGYSEGMYHLSHYDIELNFGIFNGCVTVDGAVVSVGRGDKFFKPDESRRMVKDDAIYLLAAKEKFDGLAAALEEKNVFFERIGLYSVIDHNNAEPSVDGNRVLFKVYPNTAEKTPAVISVIVSATVRV